MKTVKLHYGRRIVVPEVSNNRGRPPIDVEVDPVVAARFMAMMRKQEAEKATATAEKCEAGVATEAKRKKKPGARSVISDEMLEEAIERRFKGHESVKAIAESMGVKPKTLSSRMVRYFRG